MNKYLLKERFSFYFKTSGIDSNEAFDYHCKAVSHLIDYARTIGLEIDECEPTDCTCFRVEGEKKIEVEGWKDGTNDE